jgi:hypothetical protein
MTHSLSLRAIPLLAALFAGCGNVPEAKDFNESLVASALASCGCGGLTYGSEDKCRAELPPDEGDQACVEALFKSLDADFGPHLDCRTAANQRYAACLNGKSCTDLARLGCVTQLADEEEDCPDFPTDVQNDLNQCLD